MYSYFHAIIAFSLIKTHLLFSHHRMYGYFYSYCVKIRQGLLILEVTHLVPNPFHPHFLSLWTNDPHKIDPPGKRSPSNLVPQDKWSSKIWSPWSNGPQKIGPCILGSPQPVPLDKRNILGTIYPGGPNWLGTICPWGPNVWGPFVYGD